jgi:hypothetical protein
VGELGSNPLQIVEGVAAICEPKLALSSKDATLPQNLEDS